MPHLDFYVMMRSHEGCNHRILDTRGIKYSTVTGHVHYASTQQKLFCEIHVNDKTLEHEGELEVVAEGTQGDDLLVDVWDVVDTHRDNTVPEIPLDPKDQRRTDD